MGSRLSCDHRGERSETTGTHSGQKIPLHVCTIHGDLCSTALLTEEGYRLCRDCPDKTSGQKVNGPCTYRGEELLAGEAARLGLYAARRWFRCLNPVKPLGDYVCQCKGCGPKCSGYSQEPKSSDVPNS